MKIRMNEIYILQKKPQILHVSGAKAGIPACSAYMKVSLQLQKQVEKIKLGEHYHISA